MAFALYLHRDVFVPEDPIILDKNITQEALLSFVDFVPSVIKRSNTAIPTQEVQYHTFRVMVETANDWLRKNLEWEAINCETIILLYKYNDNGSYYEIRPDDTCFYIYGSEKNNVLKALRLWIKRRKGSADGSKKDEVNVCQTLRYLDIVPDNTDKYDFSGSRFERLDDVVARLNKTIRSGGIVGRIISVESLQCDASTDWKIDTEVSLSSFSSKSIFILRIFYEQGSPCTEEIVTSLDTRLMSFTEHGDYLRIFRVAYTKPAADNVPKSLIYLSTKLFMPSRKSDTISDIKQKLHEWVNQIINEGPPPYDDVSAAASPSASSSDIGQRPPQPRILTAETVEVFSRDFRDDHIMELEKAASGDTFHFNRFGNKNAYMFMAIRVMIDVGICGPSPSCSTSRSSSLCRTDGRGRRRSSGESRRAETCPGTSGSTATNHSCNVM